MMSKEKWIESLLDDMVESQWSEDIIRQEYERFNKLAEAKDFQSIEDLEPISKYCDEEFNDHANLQKEFTAQIEGFSKRDYEEYLIGQAIEDITEDEYFEQIEFSNDYLEGLIRQHIEEEKDFLDMVMKEAIAEDDYFQDYIDERLSEQFEFNPSIYDFPRSDDEFYIVEYPVEKEVFDDLGDTSYMDQGIYAGANTDRLEEPFEYTYYEQPFFDEDLLDYGEENYNPDDEYERSEDFIDINSRPDDLTIDEPIDENMDELIRERLFEEKYLDKVFVEIIKRDDYWDTIIREKLACDERLDLKIRNLH